MNPMIALREKSTRILAKRHEGVHRAILTEPRGKPTRMIDDAIDYLPAPCRVRFRMTMDDLRAATDIRGQSEPGFRSCLDRVLEILRSVVK